ncbi:glycosyltransferase family 2 protein [Lacticaseibacillus paracasei]|uniref:glycosyltransferase family 2 protein n=1 Tax=Lacticaseibacillus paracasei TaxID=1597 RepID=UPI0025A0F0C0|nr:glycosyltransferase family 2 protein [Lacticaseibacillus paracasei]MDM7527916.1 glycosyltransferase family 2 protein [Lacticaseibacillus paracasei]
MRVPFFTICIPTYNRGDRVLNAVKSVQRQSFKDFEILVVDDGSIDCTNSLFQLNLIQDDRVFYLQKDNGGKYTAINMGVRLARGKYFIILDSDDIMCKDTLKIMYHMLQQNPNLGGVIGKFSDKDNHRIGDPFSSSKETISYIDFHFRDGFSFTGNRYKDCFECNRTASLKRICFPEDKSIKFIPESWLFDQLGDSHRLAVTNEIFGEKEYLSDGITKNYGDQFNRENYRGLLLRYTSDINVIFEMHSIPAFVELNTWIHYWILKPYDLNNEFVVRHGIFSLLGRALVPIYKAIKKLTK